MSTFFFTDYHIFLQNATFRMACGKSGILQTNQIKRRIFKWTTTPTSVSNVPSGTAHTTARTRTTALWTRFWWAPTRPAPRWISAPTVCPSARSNSILFCRVSYPAETGFGLFFPGFDCFFLSFLDEGHNFGYDRKKPGKFKYRFCDVHIFFIKAKYDIFNKS